MRVVGGELPVDIRPELVSGRLPCADFVAQYVDKQVYGIDLGLTHLAIDDTGAQTPNPRQLNQALKRLRKASKAVSRYKKGSANRARRASQGVGKGARAGG